MIFTYDIYNRIKQCQIRLGNPQQHYIKNGIISNAKNLKLNLKFNNISEATFNLYEYEDGVRNELYDLIEPKRLVDIYPIGWFQIDEPPETFLDNDLVPYKSIKCLSLENQLVGKRIDDITGVFSIYNPSDTEHSILHIVSSLTGWSISHVDSDILGLWRNFNVDTDLIYNFLTTKVSQSFDCVFDFNTYEKSISVYLLDNIGKVTDIILSHKNLLKKCVVETYGNQIVTKLCVKGDDTCDIRKVNPNSTNYLIDVSYYLTKESEGGWMSDSLVDHFLEYKEANDNAQSPWETLMSTYTTKLSQLTTLETQLTDLKSLQSAQEVIWKPLLQKYSGTGAMDSSAYTIYINAKNSYDSYTPLIESKNAEITTKNAELNYVQTQLDAITASINMNNFLTTNEQKELENFLTENEIYQDDTFTIPDSMSEEEGIEVRKQLMANGFKQLSLNSHPRYTYKISVNNIFSIRDNEDSVVKYSDFREDVDLGNFITVKLRDDYWTTNRILEIDFDFDNLEDFELVLSEKSREDSRTTQMSEVLAGAGRTSASLDLYKYGYNQASSITGTVRNFMDSALLATQNRVFSDEHVQTEFSPYGILNRSWIEETNTYDPCQSLLTQNILLFTEDNWITSIAGIGKFTNPNNETFYGVMAPVIIGDLIMSSKLSIINASGTYSIKDDTGFTATAIVSGNTYVAGINPSTPNHILYTSVNGVDKFYIDTTTNQLVLNGTIYSSSGIIGGWTINSDRLVSPTTRMSLSGSGLNLFNSIGTYLGGIASTTSTDGGVVIVKSDMANYLAFATTSATSPYDGMSVALSLVYTTSSITIGSTYYEKGFHFRSTDLYVDFGFIKATGDISSDSYLRAGIQVTAPTGSFNNLYVGGIPVLPYSYASSSALSSLEARVSALESA